MDVTLTFLTFDLENDPLPGGDGDCKYDWLEVWDGLPGGELFFSRRDQAPMLLVIPAEADDPGGDVKE